MLLFLSFLAELHLLCCVAHSVLITAKTCKVDKILPFFATSPRFRHCLDLCDLLQFVWLAVHELVFGFVCCGVFFGGVRFYSYMLFFLRTIFESALRYISIALPIVQWGFCRHLHTRYSRTSGCKLLQRSLMWIVFLYHFPDRSFRLACVVYYYSRTGFFSTLL